MNTLERHIRWLSKEIKEAVRDYADTKDKNFLTRARSKTSCDYIVKVALDWNSDQRLAQCIL